MNLTRSRTHSEDMGTLDPCWAILSEPMNYLPEGEVRAILEQNQCRVLMSVPDNRGRTYCQPDILRHQVLKSCE